MSLGFSFHSEISVGFSFQILRKVLSNLSTKDLLSCSLVSHHWKNEARFILRNQRACLCKLKVACSCCHTCDQDLGIQKAFKDNENLPFNGLSFSMEIGQFRNCFCSLCSTFPSWIESFLNQVRVKYLKIRWKGERDHPMIHLLTKTLREKSSEIEELIIEELPTTLVNGSFKETLMLDRISLPRLKTINLPSDGASLMASMGDLISAATSLNEITGWVYPRDVLSVGLKLASVKNFWIRASHHNEAVYQIVAQHPPKLTSLAISTKYLNQTPSPHRLLETVKLLLLSSRESLEELQVELAVLLEIKTFNFLPFPRVKRIQLEYRSSSDSRLLYSIDFSAMFPNLAASSFTITAGSTLTRFPIKLNALEARTRALYHPMVSALEIYPSVLQSFPFESMPLFFSIFNNVRSYRATRIKNMADHLNSLWKFCPHLESISFVLRPHELFFNIDWILCGISLSEVELLLGKSPEFLSNYHYAAIQPCVMSFSSKPIILITQ